MWMSLETLYDQAKQCREVTGQVKSLGTEQNKIYWLTLFSISFLSFPFPSFHIPFPFRFLFFHLFPYFPFLSISSLPFCFSLSPSFSTSFSLFLYFFLNSLICCWGLIEILAQITFIGRAVPWEARYGEGVCRQPLCNFHSPSEDHGVCTGTCAGKYARLPSSVTRRQEVRPGESHTEQLGTT